MSAVQRAQGLVRGLWSGLLDLVYPPYCLVCNSASDTYLCSDCLEKIELIRPPLCRKCGIPMQSGGSLCRRCFDRTFAFNSATSAGVYEGKLREAIHALKYGPHACMAEPLAELMVRQFRVVRPLGSVDAVASVPIHRSRLIERGFNQADELARRFCNTTHMPLLTGVLVKPKRTKHQADLPQEERLTNLSGAFAVERPHLISGKSLLLIDDVLTTGSTANEAALALKESGAKAVYVYTLARSL